MKMSKISQNSRKKCPNGSLGPKRAKHGELVTDVKWSKMAPNGKSTCCWSFGTILGQFATKVLSSKRLISSWKCPKGSNRPQIINNRFLISSTGSSYSRLDLLVTHHPPNHIFRSHRSSIENYIYEHSCHCTMCTFYSMFSFKSNKLKHILKYVSWHII